MLELWCGGVVTTDGIANQVDHEDGEQPCGGVAAASHDRGHRQQTNGMEEEVLEVVKDDHVVSCCGG